MCLLYSRHSLLGTGDACRKKKNTYSDVVNILVGCQKQYTNKWWWLVCFGGKYKEDRSVGYWVIVKWNDIFSTNMGKFLIYIVKWMKEGT